MYKGADQPRTFTLFARIIIAVYYAFAASLFVSPDYDAMTTTPEGFGTYLTLVRRAFPTLPVTVYYAKDKTLAPLIEHQITLSGVSNVTTLVTRT